jgi:hypothetical protein
MRPIEKRDKNGTVTERGRPASLRAGRQRQLLLISISTACLCVASILLYLYLTSRSFEFRRPQFVTVYLVELAVILFVAPLLPVKMIISEKQEQVLMQMLPDRQASRIAFGTVAFPLLLTVILGLVPGISALAVRGLFGGVPALEVVQASAFVASIAIGAAAIGSYCSVHCGNMFSSAGLALLVILLVITEPIWLGPAIGSASFLIQPSLLINPFVGLASAMDFDLFRTEPLYQICPVGQRRFDYPAWWAVSAVYLSMSLLFFWRSVAGIRRMAEPSA